MCECYWLRHVWFVSSPKGGEFFAPPSQPVAWVLAYLYVQVSPINCYIVGSILDVLGKHTDTAIVGYRWTGAEGHNALYF